MDPAVANLVGQGLVLVVVLALAGFVARIVLGIGRRAKTNTAFLATAIAALDVPLGMTVAIPFRPAPGAACSVWLDLAASGKTEQIRFELWLAVRVGPATVLEGTFPMSFDYEQDAHGLPGGHGTTALNSSGRSVLGTDHITTVLRLCGFVAPPTPVPAEVQVRITPAPGVTITRARALVTPGEAPA